MKRILLISALTAFGMNVFAHGSKPTNSNRGADPIGDYRGADPIGDYRGAIATDAKYAPPRAALGRLYLYGGLADKAMELVEPGLAQQPKNAQLLTVRAGSRQQLGDKEGALKDSETAVQLAPEDEYAVALLASLYAQRAELDKAIQVVQTGVQRQVKNLDLRAILADLLMKKGQPAEAEKQLRLIVSQDPKGLAHRYQLAKFFLIQKNVDSAETVLREAVAAVPDNAEAKLQWVQFLAAQRSHERAVAEADALVAREPGNDTLKLSLGQFMVQAGAVDRGEVLFRGVIAHAGNKPDGLSARDRLAALLLVRNDVSGAKTLVDEALQENSRDNDALILRSNLALAVGNAPGAIADLCAVLRDQPNAVPVLRALAHAYAQNGEPDLAGEAIRNAVQVAPKDIGSRFDLAQSLIAQGSFEEAAPLLEQLAKDDPLNVQVLTALFKAQAAQKHLTEARATAAAIQKTRPDLPLGYYLTGLVDENELKPSQAESDYEQALKLQPDATEALTAVTRLNVRLKQSKQAMQRLDGIIAKQATNGLARNLKAELLASRGDLEGAIAAFQDAIAAAPKWSAPYHGLAMAQVTAKHNDEAIRTLQQGIAKSGDPSPLVVDLGALYQSAGHVDDAIALYDSLLAKDPKSAFAANNLAMLLVTEKSDAPSLARAQKLAELLSSSSATGVIDTHGWVKFKSGDYRGAELLLQQAVDKAPDSPELRYHLGMAQLRGGAQQTAVKNLEAALRSPRPFVGVNEARAALAQAKKTASSG